MKDLLCVLLKKCAGLSQRKSQNKIKPFRKQAKALFNTDGFPTAAGADTLMEDACSTDCNRGAHATRCEPQSCSYKLPKAAAF